MVDYYIPGNIYVLPVMMLLFIQATRIYFTKREKISGDLFEI